MNHNRSRAIRRVRRQASPSMVLTLLPLLIALSVPAAHAEDDDLPLYLTVSQSFTRDSNLLKTSTNEEADTLSTTAARVGLNKSYGRQTYRLDVTASHNKYSNFDQFNNNSLVGGGEFVTDIASNFRLSANADLSKTLPRFEDSSVNRTGRNSLTTKRGSVDLRYGLYGRMSVNAGYNRSSADYRLTTYDNRESDTWQVGVRYQPHDLMYYGVTYSHTDSDLRDGRVTPEHIQRRNLSLVANWRITGFSLLNGSLGYSQERYDVDPARDFNGVTGLVAWTFTPAGKVRYQLNWRRDTNNEGGYSANGAIFGIPYSLNSSANRVTNQYSASATWTATSKISSSLRLVHVRYDEEQKTTSSNFLATTTDSNSQSGRLNIVSVGVDYQAMRSLAMGCDVQKYDRTKSVFSAGYSGSSVSCNVGFTLD